MSELGEFLLGRPGVMLMTDLWSTAVGFSVLALRSPFGWRYAVPGPLVALLLVLFRPGLWGVFLATLALTAVVMGAATKLIRPERRHTVWIGVAMIAAAIVPYLISPKVPRPYQWLFSPLVVGIMFGVPIGLMLLSESVLIRGKWYAPALSSLCFAAAWGVWMARDYFYRVHG